MEVVEGPEDLWPAGKKGGGREGLPSVGGEGEGRVWVLRYGVGD